MVMGERIAALRNERGWSQRELGRRMGDMTGQTVHHWERGHHTPSLEKARQLAEAFGISLDELVGSEATNGKGV